MNDLAEIKARLDGREGVTDDARHYLEGTEDSP
jgi:hypothetical protein